MIKIDNSLNNELAVLEQYSTGRLPIKPVRSLLWVSEVYTSACHLKQSNTKGAEGLDGKILRLLASFTAENSYLYI